MTYNSKYYNRNAQWCITARTTCNIRDWHFLVEYIRVNQRWGINNWKENDILSVTIYSSCFYSKSVCLCCLYFLRLGVARTKRGETTKSKTGSLRDKETSRWWKLLLDAYDSFVYILSIVTGIIYVSTGVSQRRRICYNIVNTVMLTS